MEVQAKPSLKKIWMNTAEELAKRSECAKLQVGCIITTKDLRHVLGNGYNGGAAGIENDCGIFICQCLHAEDNAIGDSGSSIKDKVMFVTTFPCRACVTRIINSGFSTIYYRFPYKKKSKHWENYSWCLKSLGVSNIKVIQI